MNLTPEAAVDDLARRHDGAVRALAQAMRRFIETGAAPSEETRARFRYPELRVHHGADAPQPRLARAYGQLTAPGDYATAITQPEFFRAYLIEQLTLLVSDYGARLSVGVSAVEIPYSFGLDDAADLDLDKVSASELARAFPHPQLAVFGDWLVDSGASGDRRGGARPLALFDAARVDYSLKRIEHYTGAPWRDVQPWILFTNYQRYVEEFVRWGAARVREVPGAYLSCPGGLKVDAETPDAEAAALGAPWRMHQMPAYHFATPERSGVSLVNIGVGPSNAKTMTDHLAVLRPHCWLMIGHCGGLRHTQRIGDYVLAHAYLRRDKVLDDRVPLEIPLPAIGEVQVALDSAALKVSGDDREELKRRLRTGTVVSYADRNWELNFRDERALLSQSRAIAVDMESCAIAAQGFRMRVPYGVLLCVSDKPLHGEIKLPGTADKFYQRAIGEHLRIALETIDLLKKDVGALHSRKLRSFDEPPFR